MKQRLVIAGASMTAVCLLAACGSAAAPASGGARGSSAVQSGKDPANLDPCSYIKDEDLAAGVDAVYGSGASGRHSSPESTPSDDTGATSPPADNSAIPTDWQYARLSVSSSHEQLPGYSKKECHVQVSANEGDPSSPVRVNVWDFHVYFGPPDTFKFYKDEGADPVSIPGADQAESFEDVIMVKNGWTVVSGGQQAEKLVVVMLSRMAGRLPS